MPPSARSDAPRRLGATYADGTDTEASRQSPGGIRLELEPSPNLHTPANALTPEAAVRLAIGLCATDAIGTVGVCLDFKRKS